MTLADPDGDAALVSELARLQGLAPVVELLRGDAPEFASDAWATLPAWSPRWLAAIAAAALDWWHVGDPLPEVIARIDVGRQVAASQEVCRAWWAAGNAGPARPTMAQLAAWRADRGELYRRRGGVDHAGGPVPSWGPDGVP
ncbi:hypothetical protein ACQPX6_17585 [Actinomycetospora sp. CA-101289]|uniref:hypothetical protein n=1 Tax=Actinomycetospora sp. CA-101289 TaxID=3239893 RepID=UPI003D969B28